VSGQINWNIAVPGAYPQHLRSGRIQKGDECRAVVNLSARRSQADICIDPDQTLTGFQRRTSLTFCFVDGRNKDPGIPFEFLA